jgi:Uma2 family endonuclease
MPAVASRRKPPAVQPFRWTRQRYDQAIEAGVFTTADNVELLDGEVVDKMSQNELHAVATTLTSDTLRLAFASGFHIRTQLPLALSLSSEPEPDALVVRGDARSYLAEHPTPGAVALFVEVADSSLSDDRIRKAALYAEAEILEYWIVNLVDRVLEVHRDPAGGVYRTKTTSGEGETVAPLARPEATIAVADLLP